MNSWTAVIRETVFLAVLVAFVLSLGGCGDEKDTDPNPQPVAVTEVCAVSFAADGSITCVCQRKP